MQELVSFGKFPTAFSAIKEFEEKCSKEIEAGSTHVFGSEKKKGVMGAIRRCWLDSQEQEVENLRSSSPQDQSSASMAKPGNFLSSGKSSNHYLKMERNLQDSKMQNERLRLQRNELENTIQALKNDKEKIRKYWKKELKTYL